VSKIIGTREVLVIFDMGSRLTLLESVPFLNWKRMLMTAARPHEETDWLPSLLEARYDDSCKVFNFRLGGLGHTVLDIDRSAGVDFQLASAHYAEQALQLIQDISQQYVICEVTLSSFWEANNCWGLKLIQPLIFEPLDVYPLSPRQGWYLGCYNAQQRRQFWLLGVVERTNRVMMALLLRLAEGRTGVDFYQHDRAFHLIEFGEPLSRQWNQYGKLVNMHSPAHPASDALD
jgi:hypothetical protein